MPDPRDVLEERKQTHDGNIKEQGEEYRSLWSTANSEEEWFCGAIAQFHDGFPVGTEVPHVSVSAPAAAKCVESLQGLCVPHVVISTLEVVPGWQLARYTLLTLSLSL